MKHPINCDLEKHLLNGCKIIKCGSLNYDSVNGDFTHVLLECPKDYLIEGDEGKRPVKFISVEICGIVWPKWLDSTYHYSTKRHTIKHWRDNLTEDRISQIRIKRKQSQTK